MLTHRDVGHVLLPQHDQLDLVARLLDDTHGVVHVARRLGVDRQDLVVLADAVAGGLACGKKWGGHFRGLELENFLKGYQPVG